MLRRSVVLLAGAVTLVSPFALFAQPQSKVFKIGYLNFAFPETGKWAVEAFVQELRKLGYSEGKNVSIDIRYAEGNIDRLSALAADLAQQDPDVLFASNTAASVALKKATSKIPVVFATVPDPVGVGLVASLARPGANVTGVSTLAVELVGKRLQIFMEAFPQLPRVAVLIGPDTVKALVVEVQRGAKLLGLELLLIDIQQPDDIGRAATQLREWRAGAIFAMDSGFHVTHRKLLFDLAAKMGLPAMFPSIQYVADGGLMCYGADYASQIRSAAGYVHRILNGTRPADLPVEQATAFDLAINLKTARALGVKFPQSVLLRATKVIE